MNGIATEQAAESLAEFSAKKRPQAPRGLIGLIFWKELRDIFRDRRTRFGAIVSPLVIVPVILCLGAVFTRQQQAGEAAKLYHVGIAGGANFPGLLGALRAEPNLHLTATTQSVAENAVAKRLYNCAVIVPSNSGKSVESGGSAKIDVLVDSANDVSSAAAARVESVVQAYGRGLGAARLEQAHLDPQFAAPLAVNERSVRGGGSAIMLLLSVLLPYILTLNALTGGMYAANDQIAGEKERGTLETLLVSPASRREIVLGKFCAVACVCLLSGLLSITGMAIPFLLHQPGLSLLGPDSSRLGALHLTPVVVGCILLAQVPLALLCAGVLIAVSTVARNQKEVQVYQTPLVLAVVLPAMASLSISSDASWHYALVPVLNSAMVIKQSLAGSVEPLFLGVALASAFVYAAVAIAVSVKLFESERVLLKT